MGVHSGAQVRLMRTTGTGVDGLLPSNDITPVLTQVEFAQLVMIVRAYELGHSDQMKISQ